MAKEVFFRNRSEMAQYITISKPKNLMGETDVLFNNDFDGYPKFALADVYGTIFPQGKVDGKPYFYFRHTDISHNKYRFGNILEFADEPFAVQKGSLFEGKLATADTPIEPYRIISEDPLVYGFDSKEPFVQARYCQDGLYMKEGDSFSLKCEPWPIAVVDHQSTYAATSGIFQPSTFSGILNGKPFLGLGSYDRLYIQSKVGGFSGVPLGYTGFSLMGIREDGRKEIMTASGSYNEDGKVSAVYWLEGETPIVCDCFSVETTWRHLPYVNDGTCVFKDAIIRFGGKEFHFEGKWGTKGFLDKPRLEKHGQSQMFGTWYAGDKPYKHKLFYTFVENMEAYDYKLKEWGFEIED